LVFLPTTFCIFHILPPRLGSRSKFCHPLEKTEMTSLVSSKSCFILCALNFYSAHIKYKSIFCSCPYQGIIAILLPPKKEKEKMYSLLTCSMDCVMSGRFSPSTNLSQVDFVPLLILSTNFQQQLLNLHKKNKFEVVLISGAGIKFDIAAKISNKFSRCFHYCYNHQ